MNSAILATGGMDSTTLLYAAVLQEALEPTVLTVDYGHAAFEKQLALLTYHCEALNINPPVVIPVTYHSWQAKAGLFSGTGVSDDGDNPHGTALFTEQKMRYAENFIEGRNLIMVAYSMAYCSAHGIDELRAGYLRGEAEWNNARAYKMFTGDNSPQFVDTINLMAFMGFSHQVRFRAPFYEQRVDKAGVVALGNDLGVDFGRTHSCYWPAACGTCDNCILRKDVLG